MISNRFWLRTAGLAGILGGLILFTGDMLFYYNSAGTDMKMNMGHVSDLRIKLSAVSALLATWFYLFGLLQIHYAFKTASRTARNIVIICFVGILTAYGIIHGAYVAIAVSSKLAVQYNLDISSVTELATEANQLLRLFVYPVFATLSFVFIKEVWKRNTLYPRRMVFFFPLIPFLFQGILDKFLSGSLKLVIMGGFLNIILVIFFTASTILLWHHNPKTD
ncbi:MAG: hypothetical protein GXO80_08030 [Chlorobi bacterium]|nr:hypothetical protein [Chlorobiota bacterium]